MRKNESLWNITDNKYKAVMEYVNSLKPRYTWSNTQLEKFKEKITKLKNTYHPNIILEELKYKPMTEPGLYTDIDLIGKEVRKW